MRRSLLMLLGLLALVFVGSTLPAVAQDEPTPGKQVAQKLVSQADPQSSIRYWLYLPQDYGKDDREWPVMLFLHGSGERGEELKAVKVHGPPKLVEQAQPDFPFILISPQCPKDHWWPGDIQQHLLAELVEHVVAKFKTDRRRVVVTGLSMGGFGSWEMTARHPHVFAAAVPICGRGDPQAGEKLKSTPFWVFHGAKDFGVPLKFSETMVEAVTKADGQAKLTVYPEAGHDSWTETYNNNAVYEWLLAQKKPEPVKLPIANTDVAFSYVGQIKRSLGEESLKQNVDVQVYIATKRASGEKLRAFVEQHREDLSKKLSDKLASRSFNDAKGLSGLRAIQSDLSATANEVIGKSVDGEVRVLLDLCFVTLDKKLQLDP